jgi:hypothetical protein
LIQWRDNGQRHLHTHPRRYIILFLDVQSATHNRFMFLDVTCTQYSRSPIMRKACFSPSRDHGLGSWHVKDKRKPAGGKRKVTKRSACNSSCGGPAGNASCDGPAGNACCDVPVHPSSPVLKLRIQLTEPFRFLRLWKLLRETILDRINSIIANCILAGEFKTCPHLMHPTCCTWCTP